MDPFRIFCQDNLNPKKRSCPIAVQEDKSFLQKVLFFIVKNVLLEKVGAQSGPGWGPGRVGAHMGPCGPIWALMLVLKSVTFRVQTAPFDKIRTDLWRSPDTSTHLRPSGSQKTKA